MIRVTPHTAAKEHRCEGASLECSRIIRPGERYLEHVAAPFHEDLGNLHWWRLKECGPCARAYDRGALLEKK